VLLVICVWNDDHDQAVVYNMAIAVFLQKAWGIRIAYKHGTIVADRVSERARVCCLIREAWGQWH
jgi:hypothetical protein